MAAFIPARLQEHARQRGREGTQWLSGLPKHIAALEREWGFRAGPAFDHGGAASWVAPVQCRDGSAAVVKIGLPHEEARFEAEALRFLDGHGAVRLLRASEDGFSLLIERCLPGTDLWTPNEEEADAAAAGILRRLWRKPDPAAPFLRLSDLVAQWCEEMPAKALAGGYDREQVAQALGLGRELADSQPAHVVLHGDFHPGNVLAAVREPWLVIDPKPLVGDPAFDLAQWLGNRYHAALRSPDPILTLRRQITDFAHALGLDPARIAGWTFVKALGWEWGPEVMTLFQRVARTW